MDQKKAEGLKASEARHAEAQAKAARESQIGQHRPLLRPWRGGLYSLGPCQRDKTPTQFELHADLPGAPPATVPEAMCPPSHTEHSHILLLSVC